MTGLDVEAARKVLLDSLPPGNPKWRIWVDGILERLEPCVTEDPQGIDRDALTEQIAELLDVVRPAGQDWTWAHNLSLAVVALVRPVEGVTLTPEERDLNRRIVVRMAGLARGGSVLEFDPVAVGNLASRLEAAS